MSGETAGGIDAFVRSSIERVAPELVASARALPAATLHEAAGRIGALPARIKPMAPEFRLCGPAVTVESPGGDNLWLHRAIYAAEPGDVLVVNVATTVDYGYWGEIMSTAAQVRGLGGLVINGCVRDAVLLARIGFPVFACGLCIRGTGKDHGARGFINHPITIGDIVIDAGDLIVGDADGVVALSRADAGRHVQSAVEREHKEADIISRIERGERTIDVYHF